MLRRPEQPSDVMSKLKESEPRLYTDDNINGTLLVKFMLLEVFLFRPDCVEYVNHVIHFSTNIRRGKCFPVLVVTELYFFAAN